MTETVTDQTDADEATTDATAPDEGSTDEGSTPPAPAQPQWPLLLWCGGSNPPAEEGMRVIDLTPQTVDADEIVALLESSELSPADLRSRVVFAVEGDREYLYRALAVYAALCGMANRRLDVKVGETALTLAAFDRVVRMTTDAGRVEGLVHEQVQVGGEPRTDLPQISLEDGLNPEVVSSVRYSRWVRFVPPSQIALAFPQLVAVGAVRNRAGLDRLPLLCEGNEPAEIPVVDEAPVMPGLCLHTLRRRAEELRRTRRGDTRDALAEFVEPSPRQKRLVEASQVQLAGVLTRLGSVSSMIPAKQHPEPDEEVEMVEAWRCPQPQNHTNGDASPSARISENSEGVETFRCFRCLPEKVDALRLVMWARGCTPDEAADWILA